MFGSGADYGPPNQFYGPWSEPKSLTEAQPNPFANPFVAHLEMLTFFFPPTPRQQKKERGRTKERRERARKRESPEENPQETERKVKMVVEEALKAGTAEEETNTYTNINTNTNPNPNPRTGGAGEEDEEREEGEIVGGDEDSKQSMTLVGPQPHPLEHSWTFWFDNPSAKTKQVAWGSSMRPIYTFATVEEFWSIYNNIHHPSKLAVGADLHCFKHKIEPKWEDPVCANGGKWTVTFARGKSDTSWLYTLLAMIGEQFDHGDEVCGAVVNVRGKQEKIGLWTKNALNEAAQVSIGKQWKEFLDYNDTIGYIIHEDARRLERSAKSRYTV